MALSYTSISGGGSSTTSATSFQVTTGSSGYKKATIATTFPAGSYNIASSTSDTTMDIYLIAEDGTNAGSVNTVSSPSSMVATKSFNTVVIYGATNNDTLTFTLSYISALSAASTADFGAAPTITSLSASAMPTAGNTTTVTGTNFATDVVATFTGTDSVDRAGSVSRSSSTSITVTRPATLPELYAPYTFMVSNPGVSSPTTTNVHKLTSYITTKPSVPTIGTATATGNSSATVTFTAPVNNGGSTITTYTATSSPGSITATVSQAGSGTITFTTLSPGTSYTFTVTATNANGVSAASGSSNSITTTSVYSLASTINTSGSYTIPSGTTKIAAWLFGAGADGSAGGGGGSGGSLVGFKEYSVSGGQVYNIVVGASGGTTTLTSPNSTLLASAGGSAGAANSNISGAVTQTGGGGGGTSSYAGGAGGSINTNLTLSNAQITDWSASGGGGGGGTGQTGYNNGGSAGAAGTPRGGGGGWGGGYAFVGAAGQSGGAGEAPGGGGGGGGNKVPGSGGATGNGGAGGAGRVIIYTF